VLGLGLILKLSGCDELVSLNSVSLLRRAVLLGFFATLGFSVVWRELQMCLTVQGGL
jgi:hypothetical protein